MQHTIFFLWNKNGQKQKSDSHTHVHMGSREEPRVSGTTLSMWNGKIDYSDWGCVHSRSLISSSPPLSLSHSKIKGKNIKQTKQNRRRPKIVLSVEIDLIWPPRYPFFFFVCVLFCVLFSPLFMLASPRITPPADHWIIYSHVMIDKRLSLSHWLSTDKMKLWR